MAEYIEKKRDIRTHDDIFITSDIRTNRILVNISDILHMENDRLYQTRQDQNQNKRPGSQIRKAKRKTKNEK